MEVLWRIWTTWSKRVFSKQYTFLCYRTGQSRGSITRLPYTTHLKPSVKCIVISIYLNSVCYLITYFRLFTKLNLFKILFYITFITTKVSRSMIGVFVCLSACLSTCLSIYCIYCFLFVDKNCYCFHGLISNCKIFEWSIFIHTIITSMVSDK